PRAFDAAGIQALAVRRAIQSLDDGGRMRSRTKTERAAERDEVARVGTDADDLVAEERVAAAGECGGGRRFAAEAVADQERAAAVNAQAPGVHEKHRVLRELRDRHDEVQK